MMPPRYPPNYWTYPMPQQCMINPSYGNMFALKNPASNGVFDDNKSKEQMRDYLRTMFYPF
jgi:hypothetical protein